ncbi:hypothetical protein M9H77_19249 [Catharanthus roseus]|uniref:Uncharacterized protein n=1 Tax=Catharanthus roseus TaxID=4058 RepID=A0ACC0B9S4_CATRO|nr:hypothetical protein M9H77_19249 [Catharanthus roseus]
MRISMMILLPSKIVGMQTNFKMAEQKIFWYLRKPYGPKLLLIHEEMVQYRRPRLGPPTVVSCLDGFGRHQVSSDHAAFEFVVAAFTWSAAMCEKATFLEVLARGGTIMPSFFKLIARQ